MEAQAGTVRVGVDVGGTFTDFVFLFPDGRVIVRKHPTTPRDASLGVLAGLNDALAEGILAPGYLLSHGTTVATNALLERRGANVALITTRGFGDVLEIGRQARSSIYALNPERPVPLLSQDRRHEVTERVDWQGDVIAPLEESEVIALLERLAGEGIESVAVCFLYSYLNPSHEAAVGEIARRLNLQVSLSSEIAPHPREFERASTVAANAFVSPILQRYLARLEEAARGRGALRLRVMQSNGGALTPQDAGEHAIKTALSGPAGGVIAAARIASDVGLKRLLTFDMGGTSTDVALVVDGKCPIVTLASLGGIPLRTPMLDIHTVGAGGGSQAWLDSAGALRVGPRSAGAEPGPVAYGVGDILTVTDANVLLGRLPPEVRLAGSVVLDVARVQSRFAELAAKIGRSPEAVALGIIAIAETSMARALRHISVERGHDPADFVLLSFGGAGGLHACALAGALGITEVLIPRYPGALSALGLAIAPVQYEITRAFPALAVTERSGDEVWRKLSKRCDAIKTEANSRRSNEEGDGIAFQMEMSLDMRYAGQSFDLRVPFDPEAPRDSAAAFHALHQARYGHSDLSEPLEAVMLRGTLTGRLPAAPLRFPTAETREVRAADTLLHDGSGWTNAKRFERDELSIGQILEGPALILQNDSAAFLPRDWRGIVDSYSNLRLNSR